MFTLLVAGFAMLGFQAMGQEVKQSMVVDFEDPENFVEGEDVTTGYGSYSWEIVDNMWAEEDWAGGGEPADPINQSAYCMQVDVVGSVSWDGPNIVFPNPVTVSPLDPSTWFFHIQMLLPEFQVKGGTFACNIYNSPNMGNRDYISDGPAGQIKYPTDYNAIDKPNQCWVELDIDLRPYFGVTFYSIQIQGERNTGAATWYCDNIVIDDRQKNFKDIVLGDPQSVTVGEEGTQYLIFYAGTSYCMTAQDNPPTGYAQSAFTKFDPEMYEEDPTTNYQVWNVRKSAIETDRDYYTIDYEYSYLYNNGQTRALDETDAKFSWFVTKKTGDAGLRMLNAASWKYIAPSVIMEDLELKASTDTSSQWVFIPNDKAAIDAYLATTAAGDAKVKVQVPNGDYYIFYAGTNYCMTDTRPMVWCKVTRTLEDGVETKTDSMYIPGVPHNEYSNGPKFGAVYPLVLNEFAATENQQWQVQYYSDFVDLDQTHTFFKRGGVNDKYDEFGLYPLVTEHMHWSTNNDSTTRAVGSRLITSKPYNMNWIDVYGENQVVENYISVFGDNATMINDDNNQQWFVKHIPVNKDGVAAIYRPNNGIQGTALKAKYAGGALYATPNDQSGNESEKNYYCWRFVKLDDPRVATVAASQALVVKDTVFGYPKAVAPGQYYIQYRGSNQVLTYSPKVEDDIDTEVNEAVAAAAVAKSLSTDATTKANTQVWTVADGGNGRFTVSTPDGKQIYTPSAVGKALLLSEDDAAAASLGDKLKLFQGLYMGTSDMGQYGAYSLNADSTAKKFFDLQSQQMGAALATTATPGDYPFVFIPAGNALIEGQSLPDTMLVQEGYYYIQYAFAADSFDVTKKFVLSPAENIQAIKTPTILTPYDPAKAWQKWYIAPIAYDTAQLAKGLGADFCNYTIFASASVKDSLDAGLTVLDILKDSLYNTTAGYRLMDDNGTTNVEGVGVNYSWFSFKFFEKGGLVALRNAKGSSFNSYAADHIKSTVGGVTDKNNYGDGEIANRNEARTFCWYLIPANEAPAFKEVSEYATWNPLYGVGPITPPESEEQIFDGATAAENVTVEDNIITITNAEGAAIEVASVDGTIIASVASAKEVQTIAVNATGIYVVKVGNAAVKVAVK
ncbi:MAG TPA: hypothetical protein VJY37_01270 [Anaerovoracaceae bacterium]|nr:hypothetical protein [Anaerovoracaceae bacterium]